MKTPENTRSRDYELHLIEESNNGNTQALKALFEYHRGFIDFMVFRLIRSYKCENPNLDELRQAGQIGLWRSLRKFEPAAGYAFITYARWDILKEIQQTIVGNRNSLKKSARQKRLIREIRDAERRLLSLYGIERPSFIRIAEEYNKLAQNKLSPGQIEEVMFKASQSYAVSLSEPLHGTDEEENHTLEEMIADTDAETPETNIIRRNTHQKLEAVLQKAMQKLNPKQRTVLQKRFNLDNDCGSPCTLDQVGAALGGISRERVRQIEEIALRKIRHSILQELVEKDILPE